VTAVVKVKPTNGKSATNGKPSSHAKPTNGTPAVNGKPAAPAIAKPDLRAAA